jgi:hypothetical protein
LLAGGASRPRLNGSPGNSGPARRSRSSRAAEISLKTAPPGGRNQEVPARIGVSDYAFYYFNGTVSQLYPNTVPDTVGATLEALRDLGFTIDGPPERCPDGVVKIHAHVQDGRPAVLSVSPQNDMSNVRITIGPGCIGDQILSRDVLKRISVNFGSLPRDYTPVEGTLARRINTFRGLPPRIEHPPGETLVGEGLRPGERRGAVSEEEGAPGAGIGPGGVPAANLLTPFGPYFPVAPTTAPGMFYPPDTDIK